MYLFGKIKNTRLHPQGKGGPEGTICDRSLKTIWYVKITNFYCFESFSQLTHKNNSKIHFELQACRSSLVVLSFWRHTPKFPIFSRSCRQIGFKLQFDGKSVTGRKRTDGRTETDGRTNIKNLERPYTKSPFGAIIMDKFGFLAVLRKLRAQLSRLLAGELQDRIFV